MFLNSNYILSNEVLEKSSIHGAQISLFIKKMEDENDITTVIKQYSAVFLKSNSPKLPKSFKKVISKNEFTDLSNLIYSSYLTKEYGLNHKEIMSLDVCEEQIELCGKKFYKFKKEFVNKVKNKILYVLNEEECIDCYRKKLIDGFININKRKNLVWYSLNR